MAWSIGPSTAISAVWLKLIGDRGVAVASRPAALSALDKNLTTDDKLRRQANYRRVLNEAEWAELRGETFDYRTLAVAYGVNEAAMDHFFADFTDADKTTIVAGCLAATRAAWEHELPVEYEAGIGDSVRVVWRLLEDRVLVAIINRAE